MTERQDTTAREKRTLAEYIERTWGQLEKSMEETVQRSLARIKVPRREALQELAARLDRVEKRIRDLEGKAQ